MQKGLRVFLRLARTADVIVENFRPGVMEKWGLGPDTLLQRNPRLVMLRVTGTAMPTSTSARLDRWSASRSTVSSPSMSCASRRSNCA